MSTRSDYLAAHTGTFCSHWVEVTSGALSLLNVRPNERLVLIFTPKSSAIISAPTTPELKSRSEKFMRAVNNSVFLLELDCHGKVPHRRTFTASKYIFAPIKSKATFG